MSSNELLYVKGARVWVPHPVTVWEGATIQNDYKTVNKSITLLKESGSICEIKIKNESDLPPLRNPTILIGENDLTSLSYLHEPAVLHNLDVRFRERQRIYTYCGIVLVAINPYTDLPLYGSDIIRAYRGHSMGELEPHIFAVAEEAYAKLEREKCDLSIIVSGESGAGKTVSAKYAMRYFAAVGGSESETQIERKVLASSPIMEAIGNAKTTRNDNSSRFGKFTKLLFRNDLGTMTLTGAIMQTYLLEKSRVVFQASGERNYHIFYQLCAARDQWPELILDHQDKFRYLNLGGSPDIERVSDKDQFTETLTALYTLGFNSSEINDITKIIAGILHLGNISLNVRYKRSSEEIDHDGCDISLNDIHLNIMCGILKINPDELRKWLIMRQIESVNENVLIPNNAAAAEAARDALAKHIYAKLFQYIVGIVNKSLFSGKSQNCCFIGVLDIYGFETFENNSFEQFCINYANEKLQQQFNQHVFKLEQDEYLKEGIIWTMIDFYDNQPCIDLIESKLGVLDLLDEECKMPKGSDESWARKLYEKCVKYKHFEKPRFGATSFLVKHFSDVVEYEVHGFLEKNRDTVSKELVSVLRQSEMGLCKKLMELEEMDVLGNGKTISVGGRVVISASKTQIMPSKQHKQSVGSQFRDSLSLLISTLHSTTPHYVRCIKPNEEKASFKWEASKVVQQLRACGVLETVRISAAGFPSRWFYFDFYNRYRLLCSIILTNEHDIIETSKNIILKWLTDEDKYRFGLTQIFFRAGQVAYFEQIRANIRKKYIIIVQSVVRRFVYRSRYVRLQKTTLGIQRYSRGLLARRTANEIRRNRAAITIQRYIKGWYYRLRFTKTHSAICGIQKYARGFIARRNYKQLLENYKATEIQRICRGYFARQAYKKKLQSIITCQSAIRAFLARKLYKKMKREARTVSHMQKKYKGLENKIISLQHKIDELYKENTVYKMKVCEIPELRKQLDTKKALENEVKSLKSVIMEKDTSLMCLTKQFETERNEKQCLMEEKTKDMKEWREQKQTWRIENEELKKQVDEMIEMAKKEHTVSFERTRLLSEVNANEVHHAYQRAIKDKQILEIENYSLKEELSKSQRLGNNLMNISSHSRSLSNASSQNDEDFGYSSAKNTLEMKRSEQISRKEPDALETITKLDLMSSPKATHTTLILKLRKILEEEKNRNEKLTNKIERLKNKTSISTEESLRASELEVENNKLRNDYEQLRNSIAIGDGQHELEAQHEALQEELHRRREECIQLRAVLAQQSQSLKSLGSISNRKDGNNMYDGEIAEAFQAQKLVNKQLEAELMAITDENNARLEDLTKQNEELQNEKNKLYSLLYDQLQNVDDDIEKFKKNDRYLRHELQKSYMDYAVLQEKMHELENKLSDVTRNNEVLSAKLREHGVSDIATFTDDHKMLSVKKKTTQKFQGIYKFSQDHLDIIFQRLITDLTPKNAINLLPGLPAYVVFMCVRYTDLINADDQVKELLTKFLLLIKKFHRVPHTTESRVVWLVNSITLHNLLKQYGGIDEYIKINTETQNQQQLKNFDLSEYRQVIYETIFNLYVVLIVQVQTFIKPYIVPAILEHDEMATGINKGRKMSQDFSPGRDKPVPEPKSLVNQLDHFCKQFGFFGLDDCYIEQIVKQLFNYICAISMNSLMLRDKLCMWKTGMQIRYNIGWLEDWARKKNMSPDVMAPLTPLIQASSLLQARKSEEDIQTIFDLCSNLTPAQVLKIIKSYNPDDCENEISNGFIEKLTAKFSERNSNIGTDTFIMDDENIQPLVVLFKYSEIKLEEIDIPSWLKLDDLLQKI